ncbi:hypothetical protein SCAR479_11538 [Seiridium cardinale]|uniref:Cytochrome b5 heme-binding domain-containing protein n=1 Tax=Seiridium cardinale TaxID=138064 RepID=A0ABR2XD47_9PEZI
MSSIVGVPWQRRDPTAPWRREQSEIPLPRSPWAQTFYPAAFPYWSIWADNFLHSGIAPEYPSINVSDITRMDPGPSGPFLRPSNDDLDRLFVTERIQPKKIPGFRTWQVPALNEGMEPYRHGDHIPRTAQDPGWDKYVNDLIQVDETKWLKVFDKRKWFDLRVDCFTHISDPFPEMKQHATNWWTVDNPVIWTHLSLSIEIANRILCQLLAEQNAWLDALLFQPLQHWRYRDENIMKLHTQNPNYNPYMLESVAEKHLRQPSQALQAQLEAFLENHIFGFEDEPVADQGFGLTCSIESVVPGGNGPAASASLIHVGFLRALCNRNLSLPERAHVQVTLAALILHELMHATWNGRTLREFGMVAREEPVCASDPALSLRDYTQSLLQYFYPQVMREVGSSFENECFGGALQLNFESFHPYRFTGKSLTAGLWEWPSHTQWDQDLPNPLTTHLTSRHYQYVYPVPAVWTLAFTTKLFWESVVPYVNGGSAAFRAPKVFRAEQSWDWDTFPTRYFGAKRTQLPAVDWYNPSYENVHQTWQQRKQKWDVLRPWYKGEYRKWSTTPWSLVDARATIEQFAQAHSKRDLPRCVDRAREFSHYVTKWKNQPLTETHPVAWVPIALGYLMQASIPRMDQDHVIRFPAQQPINLYPNSRGLPDFLKSTGIVQLDFDQVFVGGLDRDLTIQRSDWGDPYDEVYKSQLACDIEGIINPIPKNWMNALRNTESGICASRGADGWADFSFEIPPYDDNMDWAQGVTNLVSGRNISPPSSPTNLSGRDSYREGILPKHDGPYIGPSANKRAKRKRQDSASEKKRPKYYTIGEVGDHLRDDTSVWVIESDKNCGYDVYDITEVCRTIGILSESGAVRALLLDVNIYGPWLRRDTGDRGGISPWLQSLLQNDGLLDDLLGSQVKSQASVIRARLGDEIAPIGKLLMSKRREEIAEYDGKDGMPFWLRIGNDAYDLTNFAASKKDLETLRCLAQPSKYRETMDPTSNAQMLKKLRAYRCAFVQQRPVKWLSTLRPYTLGMLRQHDSPTFGCYTAIGGYVYDLTSYIDMHPGGRQVLIKYLGKEATEFTDWHDFDIMDDYAELRIGRLVSDIPLVAVEKHQVVVHKWVFDISGLAPGRSDQEVDHWIYANLVRLGGRDLSEAIQAYDETGSILVRLYQRKDLIVGKLPEGPEVRDIPEGELTKHNDPTIRTRAWVAVNGMVYDITPIMIHGRSFYTHEIPRIWAGGPLNDQDLAEWLVQDYSHLVVGPLVKGPAWPAPPMPDKKELERKRRENELAAFKCDDRLPTNLVPEDISRWVRLTNPTPAQFHQRMAERFGLFEDSTTEDAARSRSHLWVSTSDPQKRGGDYPHPQVARLRKIQRIPPNLRVKPDGKPNRPIS